MSRLHPTRSAGSHSGRSGRRVLLAGMVTALGVVTPAGLLPSGTVAAAAAPAAGVGGSAAALTVDGVSVAVSPSQLLGDGQTVAVTVKAEGGPVVYAAEARVCRSGVTYERSATTRPADDYRADGENCPLQPVSSSADASVTDGTISSFANTAEGGLFALKVGLGVVNWTTVGGEAKTLTCDATHSCSLVVQLRLALDAPTWVPFVFDLTFRNDDPISACGGPANGVLSSGGSDRMNDAWVQWTLAACRSGAFTGAPSRGTFVGEGQAVSGVATQSLDLAYTAAGYDPKVGLVPTDVVPEADRKGAVAVPVAVNATVLAVGNGRRAPNGRKVPFRDIKLTMSEVTALLSGGVWGVVDETPAILARNPELAETGGLVQTGSQFQVGAAALPDATTWFLTNHADTLRPSEFVVPNLPVFLDEAGRTRGPTVDYVAADPSYETALSLYSGRPSLQKNLTGVVEFGAIWVFTDLGTATSLGLTPVQIENANGEFVAPTEASIAAALPTLIPADGGTVRPDPEATAATGSVQPYPLTYIEYALAPTEPLVTLDCQLRPGSDALLKSWLTYITGPGQAALPAGFRPLTPDLKATAAARIAEVGSKPLTGTCANLPEETTTTTTTVVDASSAPPEVPELTDTYVEPNFDTSSYGSGTNVGSGSGSDSGSDLSTTDTGAAPPESVPPTTAAPTATPIELATSVQPWPAAAGGRGFGTLAPLLALIGIVGAMVAAARVTAGGGSGPGAGSTAGTGDEAGGRPSGGRRWT